MLAYIFTFPHGFNLPHNNIGLGICSTKVLQKAYGFDSLGYHIGSAVKVGESGDTCRAATWGGLPDLMYPGPGSEGARPRPM